MSPRDPGTVPRAEAFQIVFDALGFGPPPYKGEYGWKNSSQAAEP
jgi:hypothetical protein